MKPSQMFGVYDAGIDGRGPSILKGVCTTQAAAKGLAGAYRHVAPVWTIVGAEGKVYVLAERSPIELNVDFDEAKRRARDSALAKLTPEDRVALGLE